VKGIPTIVDAGAGGDGGDGGYGGAGGSITLDYGTLNLGYGNHYYFCGGDPGDGGDARWGMPSGTPGDGGVGGGSGSLILNEVLQNDQCDFGYGDDGDTGPEPLCAQP